MKIVFIGCVEIGLKCVRQVLKDGWPVAGVFTLAKKYAGQTSDFVDFFPLARRYGVRLFKVKDVNDHANIVKIRKINPDLIIVCGWQQLVSEEILRIPCKGAVGFHSSLLPRYRGRAPVNWAIINGEKESGVTMFYCDKGADTGDIIAQHAFPITLNDTCATVYNKSAEAACRLLRNYLPKIQRGKVKRKKNDAYRYRFWPKRNPEDGSIDWNKRALDIHNWIRALTHPYPGAFTFCKRKKYFIWGSEYSSKGNAVFSPPGQILERTITNGGIALAVATKDKPLIITDITDENGRHISDFVCGEMLGG